MKKSQIKTILPFILIIVSYALALYFYRIMPPVIATHWGIDGQVNGYSNKGIGLFFLPILLTVLLPLFLFLPKVDPYKKNFSEFKEYFETFINLVFAFVFYIYVLVLLWNLGWQFSMDRFMVPGFAALFYYAGILMEKTKMNWFVGIRTPWTLSSPDIWKKTHRLGAKLFKITALISLFGILIPQIAFWLIIAPIIAVSVFVFAYSYVLYTREK
jgi:uncharacterized membrane protein